MNEKCPICILTSFWVTARLKPERPHDHLPSSWGRALVWYILKRIVVTVKSENTAFVLLEPPMSLLHPFPPLPHLYQDNRAQCCGYLCGLTPWHTEEPSIPLQMPPVPQALPCEQRKIHMHVGKSNLYTTFCMRESGLLVVYLHFSTSIFIYKQFELPDSDRILKLNRALNRKRFQ